MSEIADEQIAALFSGNFVRLNGDGTREIIPIEEMMTPIIPKDIREAADIALLGFKSVLWASGFLELARRDVALAILGERERHAPLLAALKDIAAQTRGDDINNPPEVRAEYYASRFFAAQKTAREAVKSVES